MVKTNIIKGRANESKISQSTISWRHTGWQKLGEPWRHVHFKQSSMFLTSFIAVSYMLSRVLIHYLQSSSLLFPVLIITFDFALFELSYQTIPSLGSCSGPRNRARACPQSTQPSWHAASSAVFAVYWTAPLAFWWVCECLRHVGYVLLWWRKVGDRVSTM